MRTALILLLLTTGPSYQWLEGTQDNEALSSRFPPPPGFTRVPLRDDDFGTWLRGLPLEQGRPDVKLFSGEKKENQTAHLAVVEIDVGTKDLQQCADAVMRLWAEYLLSQGRGEEICFTLSNGDRAGWSRWVGGERPILKGGHFEWSRSSPPENSHAAFRKYLDFVFTYAGTASLQRFMTTQVDGQIQPGNVWIQGGSPGHAVLVVDVAERSNGERRMMLVQSYMPAQQIHVLDNPSHHGTPWYDVAPARKLITPEWTFPPGSLRRLKMSSCR